MDHDEASARCRAPGGQPPRSSVAPRRKAEAATASHVEHAPCDLDTALALRAAASDCTILIDGETGVGKGHLARWLHANSRRANAAFVPVNCGAIPEGIIDSQLFGHSKGAFSGATGEHMGLVRAADGGTLLLDEVGELPVGAQLRLLRLLQEREVQPVGQSQPSIVDVRMIAATNVDLEQRITDRSFREDLLYRLNVIRLTVPPLRNRRQEILPLVDQFNRQCAEEHSQNPLPFTADARSLLQHYDWPGNVRQLQTVMERLHVFCPDQLVTGEMLVHLGKLSVPNATTCNGKQQVDQARLAAVRRVLTESNGSISRAATALGVHRSTLYRWLQRDS